MARSYGGDTVNFLVGASELVTALLYSISPLLHINCAPCIDSPALYRSVGSMDAVCYFLMKNSGLRVNRIDD